MWHTRTVGTLLNHKKKENFPSVTTGWAWMLLSLVKQIRRRRADTACFHLDVKSEKKTNRYNKTDTDSEI